MFSLHATGGKVKILTLDAMPKAKTKKKSAPSNPAGPPLELPEGDPQELRPDQLMLDPQNLRLLEAAGGLVETPAALIAQPSVQERVYRTMVDNPLFDIGALVRSIEYNGFLKHEQIIVAPLDGDHSLVLEGNRRVSAVRLIYNKRGLALEGLSSSVKQSLQTLPCFVLRGPSIDGNEGCLEEFRRASEIYIGMRHLMGAKSWEPASRYEFQWRLVKEGWTVEQVAERFGRGVSEVKRDLRAQTLYRDFREFEKKRGLSHSITYNAFAEASRAASITNWLGWSSDTQEIENKENEAAFFSYLVLKLRQPATSNDPDGEMLTPRESAETVVRKLRDMLKLGDEDVTGAITDLKFDEAELLYEDRKEGSFARRIQSYIRGLKRTTFAELSQNAENNRALLQTLHIEAARLEKAIGRLIN